jgi:hypothetical protein
MSIFTCIGACLTAAVAAIIPYRAAIGLFWTFRNIWIAILNAKDDPETEWWRWLFLPVSFVTEWWEQFWIVGKGSSRTIRVKTQEDRDLFKAAAQELQQTP